MASDRPQVETLQRPSMVEEGSRLIVAEPGDVLSVSMPAVHPDFHERARGLIGPELQHEVSALCDALAVPEEQRTHPLRELLAMAVRYECELRKKSHM